jgi:hypothetical protein
MAASFPPTEVEKPSNNDNMEVRKELHTRYASPHKLYRELGNLLGTDAVFNVEVKKQSTSSMIIHVFNFF